MVDDEKDDGPERRRETRVPTRSLVEVRMPDWGTLQRVYTINLSMGGMRLSLGAKAALVLVRCYDQPTRQMVAAAAADNATASWDGPLKEFLAALDPGPAQDWVRDAVGEPSHTTG